VALRPRLSTDLPFRSVYFDVIINNNDVIVNKVTTRKSGSLKPLITFRKSNPRLINSNCIFRNNELGVVKEIITPESPHDPSGVNQEDKMRN
jgi:hypothetical protein